MFSVHGMRKYAAVKTVVAIVLVTQFIVTLLTKVFIFVVHVAVVVKLRYKLSKQIHPFFYLSAILPCILALAVDFK